MANTTMMGRDFIRMMMPLLGLDGVGGIRKINVSAAYNEAAIVDVELIAKPRGDVEAVVTDSDEVNRRYEVVVRRID